MSKGTALIILAEGAEEIETVATADVLVRGGVDVTIAGLNGKAPVTCSRHVIIQPHKSLDEVKDQLFSAVILPGGMGGAKALAASSVVKDILKKHESSNKIIAAICAAPIAFKSHGVASGKKITSYPSVKDQLTGYIYSESRVEVDHNVVTSRGPGTSIEFGIKLVELINGKEKSEPLAEQMLVNI